MKRIELALFLSVIAISTNARANDTCPAAVHNHGGSVIVHPRVHNLYLGASFWNFTGVSLRIQLEAKWSFMAVQPQFWSRMGEYGIQSGSWGGSATAVASWLPASGQFDDSWFTSEINVAINDGQLSYGNDGNDIYVVYLPQGVRGTADAPDWGAHHGSYIDPVGRRIYYAIIEPGLDNFGAPTAGHEIAEAATDPTGNSFYSDARNPDNENEIADLCDEPQRLFTWPGTSFVLEDIWSEEACTCIQTAVPPPSDPCKGLTGTAHSCCEKPSLPICAR